MKDVLKSIAIGLPVPVVILGIICLIPAKIGALIFLSLLSIALSWLIGEGFRVGKK